MKIYLAALYSRMDDMRECAAKLRAKGHEITAQWITGIGATKETAAEAAIMDLDDVKRADAIIFFAQSKGSFNKGGGRHFEFGYAYALGKRCFVVGELEQVFCNLPDVKVFDTFQNALEYV